MRLVRLAILAVLVTTVLGALTAVAHAEEDKESPKLLCLVAKCVEEITAHLKGGAVVTETLGGKIIESETAEVTIPAKSCENPTNEGKDCTSLKDIPLRLTGVRIGGGTVKCKTEGAESGVVEVLLDLLLGSVQTASKELQPLGVGKVLNKSLEPRVIATCGVLKEEAKGALGCAAPVGLKNITTVEITCSMKNGDQELGGKCESACKWLEEEPLSFNLGNGFEDSGKTFTVNGSATKDFFIDD
jgi:hypothetical protein